MHRWCMKGEVTDQATKTDARHEFAERVQIPRESFDSVNGGTAWKPYLSTHFDRALFISDHNPSVTLHIDAIHYINHIFRTYSSSTVSQHTGGDNWSNYHLIIFIDTPNWWIHNVMTDGISPSTATTKMWSICMLVTCIGMHVSTVSSVYGLCPWTHHENQQ